MPKAYNQWRKKEEWKSERDVMAKLTFDFNVEKKHANAFKWPD
jgi:hypothetical protein